MTVDELFDNLWQKYILLSPQAKKIKKLFDSTQEKAIINDHIALRTLASSKTSIDVLAKAFVTLGYEKKEYYNFEEKSLDAYYYKHKNPKYPKVFISELKINELDIKTQEILNTLIDAIPENILSSKGLSYSGRNWSISYRVYSELYNVSSYAAWFYVFGYTANHFTVFINELEKFKGIKEVNEFVKENGFVLNSEGGEIKGSKEVFLKQSATLASKVDVKFEEGTYEVASCFYEFAKRYKDSSEELYQGFVTKSADKIFESTN